MNRKNIFTGIMLIVLAAGMILWKLNVLNLPAKVAGVNTWGLIVSAIMVIVIVHSVLDLSFGGIFIPLAVICIIFDEPLGITAITPWIVMIAAILLTIAFDMIFSRNGRRWRSRDERRRDRRGGSYYESTSDSDEENGIIMHSVRFGSATKYVRTPKLVSADLSSQFGELSVFFDGAQVPDGHVTIDCHVSFGEMDLFIPKDWRVENKVSVALGNCDDRCTDTRPDDGEVTCVIAGSVSFGELKLIRV